MSTQEKKTENSEDKEINFKVDFSKVISNNGTLVIAITSFIIAITLLYFIADDKSHNNFGDYFGGVLNPILAFISFIAILWTVALQRHSIKLQQDELRNTTKEFEKQTKIFNQQQFETTFFSLVRLMSEKQSISGNNYKNAGEPEPDYNIIYGLLKETVEIIENYRQQCLLNLHSKEEIDNFENEIAHYVNILKLQIKNDALNDLILKIIDNEKLKKYCEKYRFFEFIENIRVNEDILLKYKLSAFGDNIHYQREVSQSEYVTGDFLDKLLEITKYDEVKINIAENKKIHPETISNLFNNYKYDFDFIRVISANSSAPQNILNEIFDDIDNIITTYCNKTNKDKNNIRNIIYDCFLKNYSTDVKILNHLFEKDRKVDFVEKLCDKNIIKLIDYYIQEIKENKSFKENEHTVGNIYVLAVAKNTRAIKNKGKEFNNFYHKIKEKKEIITKNANGMLGAMGVEQHFNSICNIFQRKSN
ncbi:MAG: hypothetical protein IKI11_01085 [Neisseriaceae bacterium]|nr:hypothetical protein [Neisseriaceae bacterium]